MKKFLILLLILIVSIPAVLSAGGQPEKADETDRAQPVIKVYTSILPQKYFVERVGGEKVEVRVLVGPGKSPATYEPAPQQVLELGSSDVLFTIGVPFEKSFLPTIDETLPSLRIADTSAGVQRRHLEAHDHEDDHEDDHEHEEGIIDPHIWLAPSLVKIQAENIYRVLAELDPDSMQYYRDNYNDFISDLDEIHAELSEAFKPLQGNTIYVYHPAFGYFADEFGIKQEAIETGGKEPSPAVLEEIIEHAREENVRVIFVQPEFSKDSANAIAEAIGGTVVMLNPLNPDYLNNLRDIATDVKKAF